MNLAVRAMQNFVGITTKPLSFQRLSALTLLLMHSEKLHQYIRSRTQIIPSTLPLQKDYESLFLQIHPPYASQNSPETTT
jgi:hypothetical protein